jgi:hypothetical protein
MEDAPRVAREVERFAARTEGLPVGEVDLRA